MRDLDLAPNAKAQQSIRYVFSESVRDHAGDIRDIDALSERLTVVAGMNKFHAFTFDHAELEKLLDGLDHLRGQHESSIEALQDGIAEIDRTTANNAAIREAGY